MSTRTAAVFVLVLYVLHQDFWFWRSAHPIVFGMFPIGLFYHVAYMLVTAGVLWLLVRRAWPAHLEDDPFDSAQGRPPDSAQGRPFDSTQGEPRR